MAFLDDFRNAIENYVDNYVTFNIVKVAPVPPATESEININEVWKYRVMVSNNSILNMTGVKLHILGLNNVKVSLSSSGPFSTSVNTNTVLNVNASGSITGWDFYLKAPAVAQDSKPIIKAYILAFDVNLDHLLKDHTGIESAKFGTLTKQIYP